MEQVYQGLGRVIIVNIPVSPQSRADVIEVGEAEGDSISRLKNWLKLGEDNTGAGKLWWSHE